MLDVAPMELIISSVALAINISLLTELILHKITAYQFRETVKCFGTFSILKREKLRQTS